LATKVEEVWMSRIVEFGCIVCHVHFDAPSTPAMVHHILSKSQKRMGHLFTLPLCDGHHHVPQKNSGKIRRHPTKKAFVEAYGEELDLLDVLQREISRLDKKELPQSRVHLSKP